MKKVFIQGILLLSFFAITLFILTNIDWFELFKVKKITDKTDKTEEKLGDIFWEYFKKSDKEVTNQFVLGSIDTIVNKICVSNQIDKKYIKVHVIEKDEVNAFALPNGHLIIYTGLIKDAENPEEFSGVICHEIAHIQLNHVVKKLLKELGVSVLLSITGGNSNGEILKQVAKVLSASAYDRSLEKEADLKAVDFLVKSKIDPEPFAAFLFRLSTSESESDELMTWISTHPDSKERSKYILEYSKENEVTTQEIIALNTWEKVKQKVLK